FWCCAFLPPRRGRNRKAQGNALGILFWKWVPAFKTRENKHFARFLKQSLMRMIRPQFAAFPSALHPLPDPDLDLDPDLDPDLILILILIVILLLWPRACNRNCRGEVR